MSFNYEEIGERLAGAIRLAIADLHELHGRLDGTASAPMPDTCANHLELIARSLQLQAAWSRFAQGQLLDEEADRIAAAPRDPGPAPTV